MTTTNKTKTPRTHELKTDPDVYDALEPHDDKTFEIRFNDRDYQTGDILWLRRTQFSGAEMRAGKPLAYTGESTRRKVTHVLKGPRYGLADGWCIMSITRGKLEQELISAQQENARLREALNGFNYCTCGQSVHQEYCHKYRITKALSSTPGESWVPWSVVALVLPHIVEPPNNLAVNRAIAALNSHAPRKAGGG